MKTYYKILVLCFLFPLVAFANSNTKFKGKYTKEKTVNKEFKVQADANLTIDNKYGNITIATWDENRTVIEVIIKTNGDNEKDVQDRLNDISIDLSGNNSSVSAKTNIDKKENSWGWKNNKNVSMEINYIIKMPKSNSVNLSNIYGAISLDNLDGNAEITAKYGQVNIGNLNAIYNELSLKYIDAANIDFIKFGTINSAYSDLNLRKVGDLKLFADYTKTKIGYAGSIKYKNRYGKIRIEDVKDISGDGSYNEVNIEVISGQSLFDLRYSGLSVSKFTSSAKNVTIDGRYSRINLGVDPDYSFKLEADLNYGSLKGTDVLTLKPQEGKGRSKHYEGYYGSPSSNNKITIDSSYGTVTFKRI